MGLDISRIRALCFDIDGTLSDTDDVMVNRLSRSLQPISFLFPNQNPVVIARRLVMMFETPGNFLYGLPDRFGFDDHLAKLNMRLREFFPRSRPPHFQIIPGTQEMLHYLNLRYPMAVVSARGEISSAIFLEQFEIKELFSCIATARTAPRTKPYPDPILWAADQMQVEPAECLMIGDTTVDILSAKRAGAQSVGVLCGFGERRELERAGADLILDITTEVQDILMHFDK